MLLFAQSFFVFDALIDLEHQSSIRWEALLDLFEHLDCNNIQHCCEQTVLLQICTAVHIDNEPSRDKFTHFRALAFAKSDLDLF